MAGNKSGFTITDAVNGWNRADFNDVFINVCCFKEGNLWIWGAGQNSGRLGDNTSTVKSSPIQTISGGTNWKSVTIGCVDSAGIKSDGTLWLWGRGQFGVLGDNTIISKSSPVQTISAGTNWKEISLGFDLAAAVKTDGTLWTWGLGTGGGLGSNNTNIVSSPIQTFVQGNNWKQVSVGGNSVAAVKTDGSLWLWGCNAYGVLGTNTVVNFSVPTQTISQATNWKQVSISTRHATAIKTDGTLWTWGRNNYGQLGNSTITNSSSPTQIGTETSWKKVSAGVVHTVAIKTDGTLWTWGRNNYGQLGDNSIFNKSSPMQTITGGTNWREIAGGSFVSAGIKTDGSLWFWGANQGLTTSASLGDNTIISKSTPIQVSSVGTRWIQVSTGNGVSGAIRDSGAIF